MFNKCNSKIILRFIKFKYSLFLLCCTSFCINCLASEFRYNEYYEHVFKDSNLVEYQLPSKIPSQSILIISQYNVDVKIKVYNLNNELVSTNDSPLGGFENEFIPIYDHYGGYIIKIYSKDVRSTYRKIKLKLIIDRENKNTFFQKIQKLNNRYVKQNNISSEDLSHSYLNLCKAIKFENEYYGYCNYLLGNLVINSDPDESEIYYNKALNFYINRNNKIGVVYAYNKIAQTLWYRSKYESSLKIALKILNYIQLNDLDDYLIVMIKNNECVSYDSQEKYDLAIKCYTENAVLAKSVNYINMFISAQSGIGTILSKKRLYLAAIQNYKSVINSIKLIPNPKERNTLYAYINRNLAIAYYNNFDIQNFITYVHKAMNKFELIQNKREIANLLGLEGRLFYLIHNFSVAQEYLSSALKSNMAIQDFSTAEINLYLLLKIALKNKDMVNASAYYAQLRDLYVDNEDLLSIHDKFKMKMSQLKLDGLSQVSIDVLVQALNFKDEIEQKLTHKKLSKKSVLSKKNNHFESILLDLYQFIAELYKSKNLLKESQKYYLLAIDLANTLNKDISVIKYEIELGFINLEKAKLMPKNNTISINNAHKWLNSAKEGYQLLNNKVVSTSVRAGLLISLEKIHDLEMDIKSYKTHDKESMFMLSECQLNETYNKYNNIHPVDHHTFNLKSDNSIIDTRGFQVEVARNLGGELTQKSPKCFAVFQSLVENMEKDVVLLEYWLGENYSLVWIVDNKQIIAQFKVANKSKLKLLVNDVIQGFNEKKSNQIITKRLLLLSNALFPFSDAKIKSKNLMIVAPGFLSTVPFSTLLINNKSGHNKQPLNVISAYKIIPSLSYASLNKSVVASTVKNNMFIFSNDIFTQKNNEIPINNLYSTNSETSEIVSLTNNMSKINVLTGKSSTKENFINALIDKNTSILHVATHGILSAYRPWDSGLYFSGMSKKDYISGNALFTNNDLDGLTSHVDLITLSACETGLGLESGIQPNFGLVRSFIDSGVKKIIASSWKVDDSATAVLMTKFYKYYFDDNTAEKALQQAQSDMYRSGRYKDPYYWAAFNVYSGD